MACLLSAVLIATHDPNAFSVANDTVNVNVSKSLSVRSTTNRNLSVSQDSIVRMNLH